jgi:hypothetical protein
MLSLQVSDREWQWNIGRHKSEVSCAQQAALAMQRRSFADLGVHVIMQANDSTRLPLDPHANDAY